MAALPHQGPVPTPGIPPEPPEIGHQAGTQGVEVEVAHEFQEVGLLLHHDGLVAVLEEVAGALVPAACPPMAG